MRKFVIRSAAAVLLALVVAADASAWTPLGDRLVWNRVSRVPVAHRGGACNPPQGRFFHRPLLPFRAAPAAPNRMPPPKVTEVRQGAAPQAGCGCASAK